MDMYTYAMYTDVNKIHVYIYLKRPYVKCRELYMIIYSLVEFTSYLLNPALERGFHYSEKINTLNKFYLSINKCL